MTKPRTTALLRAAALPARILGATTRQGALEPIIESACELAGASQGFVFARSAPGEVVLVASRGADEGATDTALALRALEARGPERCGESLLFRLGPLDAPLGALILQGVRDIESARTGLLELVAASATLALKTLSSLSPELVAKERERLRAQTVRRLRRAFPELVGASPAFLALLRALEKVAPSDLPVLIQGESGTGKELLARALHAHGPNRKGSLIALNVPELPELLLESTLFGHVKGAFTNAFEAKEGVIREAQGGTLFLDEIGDLTPSVQAKLLRFLQEGEVRPLGATQPIKVSVRVVAATNKDLRREVAEGRFRADLFYRLDKLSLAVPPLRARSGDVARLARHFVARGVPGREPRSLTDDALRRLEAHDWPGNVRELENTLLKVLTLGEGAITAQELGLTPEGARARDLASLERERILEVVRRTGSRDAAARELGIHRVTLWKKMREYGVR
jgi:DNA-binding NtrC family response regulator